MLDEVATASLMCFLIGVLFLEVLRSDLVTSAALDGSDLVTSAALDGSDIKFLRK